MEICLMCESVWKGIREEEGSVGKEPVRTQELNHGILCDAADMLGI